MRVAAAIQIIPGFKKIESENKFYKIAKFASQKSIERWVVTLFEFECASEPGSMLEASQWL